MNQIISRWIVAAVLAASLCPAGARAADPISEMLGNRLTELVDQLQKKQIKEVFIGQIRTSPDLAANPGPGLGHRIGAFLEKSGFQVQTRPVAGRLGKKEARAVLDGDLSIMTESDPRVKVTIRIQFRIQVGNRPPEHLHEFVATFDNEGQVRQLSDLIASLAGLPVERASATHVPGLAQLAAVITDEPPPFLSVDPQGWVWLTAQPTVAIRAVGINPDGSLAAPFATKLESCFATFEMEPGQPFRIEMRSTSPTDWVVRPEVDGLPVTSFAQKNLQVTGDFLLPGSASPETPTLRSLSGWLIDQEATQGFQVVRTENAARSQLQDSAYQGSYQQDALGMIVVHVHQTGTARKGPGGSDPVFAIGKGERLQVKTPLVKKYVGERMFSIPLRYIVVPKATGVGLAPAGETKPAGVEVAHASPPQVRSTPARPAESVRHSGATRPATPGSRPSRPLQELPLSIVKLKGIPSQVRNGGLLRVRIVREGVPQDDSVDLIYPDDRKALFESRLRKPVELTYELLTRRILSIDGKAVATESRSGVLPIASWPRHEGGRMFYAFIGVGKYDNTKLSQLETASNDPIRLAYLVRVLGQVPPERILLLSDTHDDETTRASIEARLLEFVGKLGPDDQLIVHYSSHGLVSTSDGTYCLATRDTDPERPAETGLPFGTLLSWLVDKKRCASTKVALFLDACHSGSGIVNDPQADDLLKLLKHGNGVAALCSSTAIQTSRQSLEDGLGLFTAWLVQGLEGQADADHDGEVEFLELVQYTTDRARRDRIGGQKPVSFLPTTVDNQMSVLSLQGPARTLSLAGAEGQPGKSFIDVLKLGWLPDAGLESRRLELCERLMVREEAGLAMLQDAARELDRIEASKPFAFPKEVYRWRRAVAARLILGSAALVRPGRDVRAADELSPALAFARKQADAARRLIDLNPDPNLKVESAIKLAAFYQDIQNASDLPDRVKKELRARLVDLLHPQSWNMPATISKDGIPDVDLDLRRYLRDRLAAASTQVGLPELWDLYIKELKDEVENTRRPDFLQTVQDAYGREFSQPVAGGPLLTRVFYLEHILAAHAMMKDSSGAEKGLEELFEVGRQFGLRFEPSALSRAYSWKARALSAQPELDARGKASCDALVQEIAKHVPAGNEVLPLTFDQAARNLALTLVALDRLDEARTLADRLPGHGDDVRLALIQRLLKRGKVDDARAELRAMRLTAEQLEAHRLLARVDGRSLTGQIEEFLNDTTGRTGEDGRTDPTIQAAVVAGLVEALARRPWDQLLSFRPSYDNGSDLTMLLARVELSQANQVLLTQARQFSDRPATTTPPTYRPSPSGAAYPMAGGWVRGGGDAVTVASDFGRALDTASRIYSLVEASRSGNVGGIIGNAIGVPLSIPTTPSLPVGGRLGGYIPSIPSFPGRSFLPF